MLRRGVDVFAAAADPRSSNGGWQYVIAVPAGGCRLLFKLLCCVADNPFVQKSAIILGLTLALSAATLAAIADWADGGSSDSAADPATASAAAAGPGKFAGNHLVAVAPVPANSAARRQLRSPNSPNFTIERTVPEVRLEFTVADEQGRLVHDLSAKDIRILDNQAPVERFPISRATRICPCAWESCWTPAIPSSACCRTRRPRRLGSWTVSCGRKAIAPS